MEKKYITKFKIIGASMILFLLILSPITLAAGIVKEENIIKNYNSSDSAIGSEYNGHLRIYIVEMVSRWKMDSGLKYHNSLYDFAYDDEISIRYLETYEDTISWSGDIDNDNLIVMAAIFNEKGHTNYADPPDGRPFTAHYVDAAAAAEPGETGTNTVNEDFTHTVFLEKGTASWCPSCPGMASKVKNIYESGDYPFYYVSMVVDKSNDASRRMNDFSLYFVPTGFYDGGKDVIIGGSASESEHRTIIEECGTRDVHDLDFSLSVESIGEEEIQIDISITNNEELPNSAPETPIITGPKKVKTGEEAQFTISTTDPDGDDVYYCIDWGEGTDDVCIGPYSSGEQLQVSHTWEEEGSYIVRVKAKDMDDAESDYAQLSVSVPRSKGLYINSIFRRILEIFPTLNNIITKLTIYLL